MKKLQEDQLAVWRTFLNTHSTVIRLIEKDLLDQDQVPLIWYDVLVALYQTPSKKMRMSELADKVVLTPSGITRLVERLEKEGYVRRERTEEDRRGSYAVLTREGKRAFLKAWPIYEQGILSYFIRHLEEDELRIIQKGLARIHTESTSLAKT
ncbi:MarR family winged helix-turn-helix transcriptional regulator [Paenibacillus alba]|uniref:MarR family winged helix-turn-helix transcriptional regulator n=1 Tax=Paenibacillus alba TaxID=1197127 RepID=A0ABU6GBX7_9BACL|nr:MarR family winged helix-turn-helix transcriptional regulator [Paenibacillus alba]MEC0231695.1 MarR family winged helix-turn-helix transcriptional regulator [Paenibacillus alba]NQX71461.1 winged helix-turn-helix transcriptional regulator [Paenibacillus alba]